MGTKYTTQSASGYNSSPPADDGTQVASNLVTWAGVKTKLADPIKTLADAENTALVAALDLSARAISSPDTAIASDHWKTLQVTGSTTITLSSAASMGAGYEVGVFNAGVGVVTVTPGNAADTINGVSASVTVSIKGTKIFRTNQALTGYNVVGGYDPQTITASTSMVTPLVTTSGALILQNTADAQISFQINSATKWAITSTNFRFIPGSDNALNIGDPTLRVANVFTPIVDTGTTGSGTLKTNNGTTVLTWDNNGGVAWGTGVANRGTITKRKTADESVTSSTVLQDDDHLTFAIAANEEWKGFIDYTFGDLVSTTGIKAAMTFPAGATVKYHAVSVGAGAGNTQALFSTTSGSALDFTAAGYAGSGNASLRMSFWVLNGATPGNVTSQFAQSTSSGTALKAYKGSWLDATRVA